MIELTNVKNLTDDRWEYINQMLQRAQDMNRDFSMEMTTEGNLSIVLSIPSTFTTDSRSVPVRYKSMKDSQKVHLP